MILMIHSLHLYLHTGPTAPSAYSQQPSASGGDRGTKCKQTTSSDCDDMEVNFVRVRKAENRIKKAYDNGEEADLW